MVVGSGIAGLTFALRAAETGSVAILTKSTTDEGSTKWAQGGIASVTHPDDDFEGHIRDTLVAGDGLCDEEAVGVLVREGPSTIRDLVDWGVRFTRESGRHSPFHLHREGGHHRPRILHAGDITGAEIERALLEAARRHPNIEILERRMAMELVTGHFLTEKLSPRGIVCHGAYVLDRDTGTIETWLAPCTVLCTGGAGQVYLYTTNPSVATGDGIAMAWRAGARIANMEFMQFHPTMLYDPSRPAFLISEAVRGAGAILRDSRGEAFMRGIHPLADLAPRDIVTRAIDRRMKELGDPCVFLDLSHVPVPEIRKGFPTIYARCLQAGVRMGRDPIPVVPSAHFLCGGVDVDQQGCSSIAGLYAVGECAHTGVHGANRLASNSLLEAVVFSRRAFAHASEQIGKGKLARIPTRLVRRWDRRGTETHREEIVIRHDLESVQRTMWDYVGIQRSTERLLRARKHVKLLRAEVESFYKRTVITPSLLDLRNVCEVAGLIIECALARRESRGLHAIADYPGHQVGTPVPTRIRHRITR